MRGGGRPRRGDREAGSAALELVVVFPIVLVTLLTVIQVALIAHATHVAQAAAREGARAARLSGESDVGRQRAEAFLARLGAEVVLQPAVTATVEGQSVAVEVRGRAVGLVPGVPLDVRATTVGPLERFVPARSTP